MKFYFKAYKHDKKLLKEIWENKCEYSSDSFDSYINSYTNFCWSIKDDKITGYSDEYFYINRGYIEIKFDILYKIKSKCISATEARKLLEEFNYFNEKIKKINDEIIAASNSGKNYIYITNIEAVNDKLISLGYTLIESESGIRVSW